MAPKLWIKELENFFVNWNDRISQKLLSLIIIKDYESLSLEENDENMKIIETYMKIGFIKNFKIVFFLDNQQQLIQSKTIWILKKLVFKLVKKLLEI